MTETQMNSEMHLTMLRQTMGLVTAPALDTNGDPMVVSEDQMEMETDYPESDFTDEPDWEAMWQDRMEASFDEDRMQDRADRAVYGE